LFADNIMKIKALEYDDGIVQGQGHRKAELTGDRCLIGHASNASAVTYSRAIVHPAPGVLTNPHQYDHVLYIRTIIVFLSYCVSY